MPATPLSTIMDLLHQDAAPVIWDRAMAGLSESDHATLLAHVMSPDHSQKNLRKVLSARAVPTALLATLMDRAVSDAHLAHFVPVLLTAGFPIGPRDGKILLIAHVQAERARTLSGMSSGFAPPAIVSRTMSARRQGPCASSAWMGLTRRASAGGDVDLLQACPWDDLYASAHQADVEALLLPPAPAPAPRAAWTVVCQDHPALITDVLRRACAPDRDADQVWAIVASTADLWLPAVPPDVAQAVRQVHDRASNPAPVPPQVRAAWDKGALVDAVAVAQAPTPQARM